MAFRLFPPQRAHSALSAVVFLLLLGAAATAAPAYTDVTARSGVNFVHAHGGSGQKYFCETMGAGVLVWDYDNDGHQDLYFVNGAALPGFTGPAGKFPNRLYHGRGDGTFEDVTERAGLAGTGYGMGASAADYDGDGYLDLYVTNFGANVLYHNNRDGTFTDVTAQAGVGDPRWSTSSAWADMDGDGDLDLFVANYVDFDLAHNKFCGKVEDHIRAYCHPDAYPGISDRLYRNNGDGTFTDVTAQAGVENAATKGLGVIWLDYDNDGDQDIYVANDSTVNLLYRNRGNGTFEDMSLVSGTGYNENGATEAGMGVDAANLNGDAYPDLVVTNLDLQGITLYLSNGDGNTYTDAGFSSGLKAPSMPFVGFGTVFLDYDNDGDQDVYVTNGHIIDNIELFRPGSTYAQPDHLYVNDGSGHFQQLPDAQLSDNTTLRVGRGLAVGDFNEDGTPDLAINHNNGPAQILLGNPVAGHHWLRVRLAGKKNRFGVGARVTLTSGGRIQWKEVRTGGSYCSQSSLDLHFGLDTQTRIEKLEIRWPGGAVQTLTDVAADQVLTVHEP